MRLLTTRKKNGIEVAYRGDFYAVLAQLDTVARRAAVEEATGADAVALPPTLTVTAESVGVAAASLAVTVTVT